MPCFIEMPTPAPPLIIPISFLWECQNYVFRGGKMSDFKWRDEGLLLRGFVWHSFFVDLLPIAKYFGLNEEDDQWAQITHFSRLEVCHTETGNPHYLALVVVGSTLEIDLINPSKVKAMISCWIVTSEWSKTLSVKMTMTKLLKMHLNSHILLSRAANSSNWPCQRTRHDMCMQPIVTPFASLLGPDYAVVVWYSPFHPRISLSLAQVRMSVSVAAGEIMCEREILVQCT